jgi:hypothetical protein
VLHSGTESLQGRRHTGELLPARHVVAQQLLLAGQSPPALLQVAPPPLVLVERQDRPKIGVGEPLELLGEVRLGAAQRLAARLQLLRQPCPAMGTCDSGGERLRLGQQGAEILPHQLVELTGGRVAGGAARGPVRVGAVPLAVAQIVEVPPVDRARRAGEAAAPAAHQRAQQVLVRRVVP